MAGPMSEKVLRLLDAILEAYDSFHTSKEVEAGHVATFCNFAVDLVLARMGYEKMRNPDGSPMMANQMVDFMTRSADWEEVLMEHAQTFANDGRVVVAGREEEGHGHVVVVRPGVAEYSGKYAAKAPRVSHVGLNSHIGRSAAWAFDGVFPPKFWLLKEAVIQ
jgi:hypothetical protein